MLTAAQLNKYKCEGQMTLIDLSPKCAICRYEVVRPAIGAGLPMCDHPLLMASPHGRWGGKFTAHYDPSGVDHPDWCPIVRPELYEYWKEET